MPLPGIVLQVEDGIGGARVTVARLADRARVEDGPWSQGHLRNFLRHPQLGGIGGIGQVVEHGQVGVTHEAIGGVEEFEADGGSAGVEQVFPHRAEGAAVHQGDVFEIQTIGQVASDTPCWLG